MMLALVATATGIPHKVTSCHHTLQLYAGSWTSLLIHVPAVGRRGIGCRGRQNRVRAAKRSSRRRGTCR